MATTLITDFHLLVEIELLVKFQTFSYCPWDGGAGEDSWESLGYPLEQGDQVKPVDPKRNQLWIFIRRTDAEIEAPKIWLPDVKSRFIGKEPDAGEGWGLEEKWVTEDEMVGWHHQHNGHKSEQSPGDNGGQESLVCCSRRGHKQSDMS